MLSTTTLWVCISNQRIIRMDEKTVAFSMKGYRNEGHWRELTLSGTEFIRRFLMHMLLRGFVRIRLGGVSILGSAAPSVGFRAVKCSRTAASIAWWRTPWTLSRCVSMLLYSFFNSFSSTANGDSQE